MKAHGKGVMRFATLVAKGVRFAAIWTVKDTADILDTRITRIVTGVYAGPFKEVLSPHAP